MVTDGARRAGGRRYRVLYPVGRGGFGMVYRAEMLGEEGFRRPVALKVLRPDRAGVAELAQRFRDEARLLGLLRHRAIVQVDGLVEMGGLQVVVMEYIEGADLAAILERGPIPLGPALEIVGEVAGALDVAWRRHGPDGRPLRLTHRDIKPGNIRISPDGEVKVLDFGIARADFDSREASTRQGMFGSVGYIAPERFAHEDCAGSDVFSLGVVLIEALTAQRFGPTGISVPRIRERVDQMLASVRRPMPADVVQLVLQMLEFDAEDRPMAREVEARCWELARTRASCRLRNWASAAVEDARRGVVRPDDEDGLSETILVENSGQRLGDAGVRNTLVPAATFAFDDADSKARGLPGASTLGATVPDPPLEEAEPVPDPPHRRRGGRWAVLVVALVVSAIGAAVIGTADGWRSAESLAVRPAPPAGPVVGESLVEGIGVDSDAEQTPAQLAAAPAPSRKPKTQPPRVPPPAPRPEPPAPEPAPPATGLVRVLGDANQVVLRDTSGRDHPPGTLSPGAYSVVADFGAGPISAGVIDVSAGSEVVVSCRSAFRRCQ